MEASLALLHMVVLDGAWHEGGGELAFEGLVAAHPVLDETIGLMPVYRAMKTLPRP